MRLKHLYHREALRCLQARAYVAGAVMVGAALETTLMALVHVRDNEILSWPHLPKKRRTTRPVLEWDFATLLRAAEYAGWLPRNLADDEEFSYRKAARGDYARLLHLHRNLVHPTRYIQPRAASRSRRSIPKARATSTCAVSSASPTRSARAIKTSVCGCGSSRRPSPRPYASWPRSRPSTTSSRTRCRWTWSSRPTETELQKRGASFGAPRLTCASCLILSLDDKCIREALIEI